MGKSTTQRSGGPRGRQIILSSDDESIVAVDRTDAKRRRRIHCSDDEGDGDDQAPFVRQRRLPRAGISDATSTTSSPRLHRVSPKPVSPRPGAPNRNVPPSRRHGPASRRRNRRTQPPKTCTPGGTRSIGKRQPIQRVHGNAVIAREATQPVLCRNDASCEECGRPVKPFDAHAQQEALQHAATKLDASIRRSQRQRSATAQKLQKLRKGTLQSIPKSKPPRGLFLDIHGGSDEWWAATRRKPPASEVAHATKRVFGASTAKQGAIPCSIATLTVRPTGEWAKETAEDLRSSDPASRGMTQLIHLFQEREGIASLARASPNENEIESQLEHVRNESSRTRALMDRIAGECDARMQTLDLFERSLRARCRARRHRAVPTPRKKEEGADAPPSARRKVQAPAALATGAGQDMAAQGTSIKE